MYNLENSCSLISLKRMISSAFYGIVLNRFHSSVPTSGDSGRTSRAENEVKILPRHVWTSWSSTSGKSSPCHNHDQQGGFNCGASSQADFFLNYFLSNFLSNSPFPPSPAGRLEKLKPPWWSVMTNLIFLHLCLFQPPSQSLPHDPNDFSPSPGWTQCTSTMSTWLDLGHRFEHEFKREFIMQGVINDVIL